MLQRFAAVVAVAGLVVTVACSQTDAGITTSVKTRFAADDTVKAYQINVDTSNAVVTLSGDVETMTAKEQAIRIARETNGVRDVIDQMRVNAAAGPDVDIDLERRAESGAAELKEAGRDAAGAVREAGRDVGGAVRDAGREAGDVAGTAGVIVADAAITTAVKARLLADTTVKGLQIDVDTEAGAVTLNGTASRAEADRAVMLARNTSGVKRVVDNLRMR